MDPIALLEKYFGTDSHGFRAVSTHSRQVADKALAVAAQHPLPGLDLAFIVEAALLHDIGVCRVSAPAIGCHGAAPYILHGIIGREILEAEGLPRHAMVCERHIGVGVTMEDIDSQLLPLPRRDMRPQSMEEKIVCFADLYFSKTPGKEWSEKSEERIRKSLASYGAEKVEIFDRWLRGEW